MSYLIDRQQAINALKDRYYKYGRFAKLEELVLVIENLPSAQPELIEQGAYVRGFEQGRTQGKIDANLQPEEAIPISWIEAMIKKFMMTGDAFSGLTASIIRVMLNEWKKEQEEGANSGAKNGRDIEWMNVT